MQSFTGMCRAAKHLTHLSVRSSVQAEQGDVFPLCLSSFTKQMSFCGPFSTMVFLAFLCLLLVSLVLKMASTPSAEVMSSVSKHKKTVIALQKKYICWISFVQA